MRGVKKRLIALEGGKDDAPTLLVLPCGDKVLLEGRDLGDLLALIDGRTRTLGRASCGQLSGDLIPYGSTQSA